MLKKNLEQQFTVLKMEIIDLKSEMFSLQQKLAEKEKVVPVVVEVAVQVSDSIKKSKKKALFSRFMQAVRLRFASLLRTT